jgi:hypothetical protein
VEASAISDAVKKLQLDGFKIDAYGKLLIFLIMQNVKIYINFYNL